MRLAWLTDIHLNFLDANGRRRFLESVKEQADVVAVSGDIGESHDRRLQYQSSVRLFLGYRANFVALSTILDVLDGGRLIV